MYHFTPDNGQSRPFSDYECFNHLSGPSSFSTMVIPQPLVSEFQASIDSFNRKNSGAVGKTPGKPTVKNSTATTVTVVDTSGKSGGEISAKNNVLTDLCSLSLIHPLNLSVNL